MTRGNQDGNLGLPSCLAWNLCFELNEIFYLSTKKRTENLIRNLFWEIPSWNQLWDGSSCNDPHRSTEIFEEKQTGSWKILKGATSLSKIRSDQQTQTRIKDKSIPCNNQVPRLLKFTCTILLSKFTHSILHLHIRWFYILLQASFMKMCDPHQRWTHQLSPTAVLTLLATRVY